jgi:hypothetical protein
MGLFSATKKDEKSATVEPATTSSTNGNPVSGTRMSGSPPGYSGGKVGIDHAIQLMRSLPTDKNVDLVVTVLKTTLESLGIRVTDIVQDASNRQQELEKRVAQLKSEISALEKEVDARVQEITKVEAAHSETTRVREYLETTEIDVAK